MKSKWLLWLALLLTTGAGGYFAATFDSGTAKISVKAVSTARVGQLVLLDASESRVDSFKWQVTPTTPNFMVIDCGRRAFFSGESPGTYTFWVAGALDKTVDLQSFSVVVGESPLKTKLREWWALVPNKQATRTVAATFLSVSQQINAGLLKTPDDVIRATAAGNRGIVGWESFGEALRQYLNEESKAGRLSDMPSHAALWFQIGTILEELANGEEMDSKRD
jgi:hypothetical protein